MEQPSYFSIIPATVRYDYSLTMTERMLFSEITALSNKYGYCTAGNAYFAKLYKTPKGDPASKQSVSRWLRHLKEKGYVRIEYKWNDSKTVRMRRIYPLFETAGGINKNVNPPSHSSYRPLNKNVKENNTSKNNTSINIDDEKFGTIRTFLKAYQSLNDCELTNQEISDAIGNYLWKLPLSKIKDLLEKISMNSADDPKAYLFKCLSNALKAERGGN